MPAFNKMLDGLFIQINMDLFQQIAQVKQTLSGQLDAESQVKLDLKFAEIKQAKKDFKTMQGYITGLQLPLQESQLNDATQQGLDNWKVRMKTQLNTLIENKVKECQYHINKVFQLDIAFPKEKYNEVEDTEGFLKIYFQVGGISSLNQAGIDKVKADFSKNICYRNRYKIIGKTMTLMGYKSISAKWTSGYELSGYSCSRMEELVKAINLFEFGKPENHWFFHSIPSGYDRDVKLEKYEFQATKVKSLQFFKNSNLKLGFSTPEHAQDFAKYFQLDQKEERRW